MRATRSGEPAALRRLVLDARARRTDDRELRCDEQRVRQHEQQDDEKQDQRWTLISRPPLGVGTRRAAPTRTPVRRPARLRARYSPTVDAVAGRRQLAQAAVTRPPTVVASVSHAVFEQRGRVVDRHFTGHANAPVAAAFPPPALAGLELVADVAEQLREHVFEREQAGSSAELVHDERLMRPPLAQVAQDSIDGHAFVHAGDRPDETGSATGWPP